MSIPTPKSSIIDTHVDFGVHCLPAKVGLGFKPEHFSHIMDTCPDLGFFEVHAENYLVDGGPFHHHLTQLRARYPLSIHGVGLSIGAEAPLDLFHLKKIADLVDRYAPQSFSEHLAWSSHGGVFLNDLLPIPYTNTSLQRVCDHIDQIQNELKRHMLLENPATYLEFNTSTMTETAFMTEVLHRTGCGLLLDVNNVHVSCSNHRRNAQTYIQELPHSAVKEIHLAGFTRDSSTATDGDAVDAVDADFILIDSHCEPIDQSVWNLYQYTLQKTGPIATLIERDNNIPPFDVLLKESQQAAHWLESSPQKHKTSC